MDPGYPDRRDALFFDLDGTLVDIAERPDAITVPREVPVLLARLNGMLGGALAVVSGRPLAEIDHHLRPLKLCAAGVHGAERRGADGRVLHLVVGDLHAATELVEAACAVHPGLQLENKPGAIALHYRRAPQLEDLCLAVMGQALQLSTGMELLRGKMVVELKSSHTGKGLAVASFLSEAPFRGRRPWFFGDDLTDESAFEFVQQHGGVAVKVGTGPTLAPCRLADPRAVRQWLARAGDAQVVS